MIEVVAKMNIQYIVKLLELFGSILHIRLCDGLFLCIFYSLDFIFHIVKSLL